MDNTVERVTWNQLAARLGTKTRRQTMAKMRGKIEVLASFDGMMIIRTMGDS